jgi:DNA polymerase-1
MTVLVNRENLSSVVAALTSRPRLSLDTETTGLEPFLGDRVFSVIIADESEEYYFNFNIGGFHKAEALPLIQKIIDSTEYMFFINYDYDYTMLAMDGVYIDKPKIIDGGVAARLENSSHEPSGSKAENQFFSMDYLAKHYLGKSKDSTVENYIKDNSLYGVNSKGKKKPLYDKVPLDIMFNYGCNDARITFDVCTEIIRRINARDIQYESTRPKSWPKIMHKLANESALSQALAATKLRGVLLDKEYCQKAREHELANAAQALKEIKKTVNLNVNSPKQVQNYLMNDLGLDLPPIIKRGKPTGGYSTDAKTLDMLAEKHDMPMLQKIVGAKRSQKKANTYYKNYLEMVDESGLIHCSLGQETTVTGRLSSFSPNLQNIHKEKYHKWAVRNAFKCPKDFYFLFMDYSAQEMRVMIDLSGDDAVAKQVLQGKDIYIAMGEMVKNYTGIDINRQQAKALALGTAYGQGKALIARGLRCQEHEAAKLKQAFKASLKGVAALDDWCKNQAQTYGKIHNPYGRVSHIQKNFTYKALNSLIQGTAADITKTAYVNCFRFLQDYKSNIVLSVHDELAFFLHKDEKHLINDLKKIMIDAYPHRSLPMGVDVEISSTTWAAKKEFNLAV